MHHVKDFKNGIHSHPATRSKRNEKEPISLLAVSWGKSLKAILPSFMRQTGSEMAISTKKYEKSNGEQPQHLPTTTSHEQKTKPQKKTQQTSVPSKILVGAQLPGPGNVRKPPDKFWQILLNKRLQKPH